MLSDLTFKVDATKEPMEVLADLLIFADKEDLDHPSYWGQEEAQMVYDGAFAVSILRAMKEQGALEEFISNVREKSEESYMQGMSSVENSVPLMVDVVSYNCPKYVTFELVGDEYRCVPDEIAIKAGYSKGEISNAPDADNAVYVIEGTTYYVKDKQVEWML